MTLEQLYRAANGGALALGFAMLMFGVWYYITQLAPAIKENTKAITALIHTVAENQKVNEKLIENNASAFRELSFSNQNVATALDLLTRTMEQQDGSLIRHEAVATNNFDRIEGQLEEQTKAIDQLRSELGRHVAACDARYTKHQHP